MTNCTLIAGMKFFETKGFKALNSKWRAKLKKRGFEDHEDEKENLYDHDRRTVLFDNRERVLNFHLKLSSYLHRATIPRMHRKLLELYNEGKYVKHIAEKLGISRKHCTMILKKYRELVNEM